jgi:hypothetical protein
VSIHQVYIVDAATGAEVEVALHDDLSADVLLDVEDQWAAHRQRLRGRLRALGVGREKWPESLHWDWGRKSLSLALLGDPDDFRVMGLRRQTVWEAAMVTRCRDHAAALAPDRGKPIVYVDYLEVAPWNWTIEQIQARKFRAVGPILLRMAIEQSYAKGWHGRVGLHALPQAASFYLSQGLQWVRNDRDKQGLPYYELSAAEAFRRTERK